MAICLPFVTQTGLMLLAVMLSHRRIYNIISETALVISVATGLPFLLYERRPVIVGLIYTPVMLGLLLYFTLAVARFFGDSL